MSAPRTTHANLRRLVTEADTADLVLAYVAGLRHPFAFVPVGDEMRFICPTCSTVTINGGTARVIDQWRWSCHACRRTGTRYVLERIVLEDAAMLSALAEIVEIPR